MFDYDFEDSSHQQIFPRTTFNFYSMNSTLLEPWNRQETPKKQPAVKLQKIKRKEPILNRAGTEELVRKKIKKKQEEENKIFIPISTLTFNLAEKESPEKKKEKPVVRMRKTAKSEGKFIDKPTNPAIFNQQKQQDKEKAKGIKSTVEKMPRFKNKIHNNKNTSYILSKKSSFTDQSKPIISQVNLGAKQVETTQREIEENERQVKRPKKIFCVGLLKFKNQQKKVAKRSYVRGFSFGF